MGKNKKQMQTGHNVKSKNEQQDEQCYEVNRVFIFSALLSFWDLICNDEFNSGSSYLNWLDNFGLVSLQKL